MKKNKKLKLKDKLENYPSIYDYFELGDRVERIHVDKSGKNKIFKGIILGINDISIDIYWDTLNGKYRPEDLDIAFTNCPIDEIFDGTNEYSPLKKK